MKIIPPVELTSSNSESTAPGDDFSVWQPVGRNFLSGSQFTTLAAANGFGYLADTTSVAGIVYIVELATGNIEEFDTGREYIYQVTPSPDGNYLGVGSFESGLGPDSFVDVFDLSSGTTLYTDTTIPVSKAPFAWSYDSSRFIYHAVAAGGAFMRVVSSASWSAAAESDLYNDIAADIQGLGGDWDTDIYRSVYAMAPYGDSQRCAFILDATYRDTNPLTYRQFLVSFNLADASYDSRLLSTSYVAPRRYMIHNPARDELILFYSGTPQAVDDATLSDAVTSPDLPACDQAAISPSGDQIVFRTTSVSPRFRRVEPADYSELADLDSVIGGDDHSLTYDASYYFVALASGGYSLIDRLDDTPITETNPSVTAGDTYTYQGKNYEVLADNADRPDQGSLAEPPTWLDLGAINPLRMFDGKLDSLTTATGELIVSITPGQLVNGLALFNVTAQVVNITVEDPDAGTVYDSGDISMRDNSVVLGWHNYFFTRRPKKADLARIDLPTYPNATINISFSSAEGGAVAVGEIVLGRVQTLGNTQYASSVSITDSSRKERDQFGNFNIIERPFSKRADYDVHLPRAATSGVQRILAGYRAKPIVYLADTDEEALILYGFYKDFEITYQNFSVSAATITVEGL